MNPGFFEGMKRKEENAGLSGKAAAGAAVLLVAVCTAIVILNDSLASKIGLVFNIMLAVGLAAWLTHFAFRALAILAAGGKRKPALEQIDEMEGREFEEFCAGLLENLGFTRIEFTGHSADQGTDLLAWKDDLSYALQCKRYEGHVGNKAVQEAFAGKTYYGCDVAVVITNSYFTPAAEKLAQTTGVLLWDRDFLRSTENCFPKR